MYIYIYEYEYEYVCVFYLYSQVNLEHLARVVFTDGDVLYPDSVVGTDSHTTMIDGLGVLGWGVGGIEAEATMLGQPIYMVVPQVVGFQLTGELPDLCEYACASFGRCVDW